MHYKRTFSHFIKRFHFVSEYQKRECIFWRCLVSPEGEMKMMDCPLNSLQQMSKIRCYDLNVM